MADKRIDELVAATTVNDDDLLVLQQGAAAKKLSGRTLGDYVYSAAAEKIVEVQQAIADSQDAVDDLMAEKNAIAESVASMAELGTDTSLTTTGMAADAEATGDAIDSVVLVADTEPDEPFNKVWIAPSEEEFELVEKSEFDAQSEAIDYDIKTIFNIDRYYSLGLVASGTMQPGGNNGSNSAKNTRTDYLNYAESMIVYMDNSDYEFCVWGYPGKSTANRVAFTNSAYISSGETVVIKKTSNLHYFRIGFHRKDGTNLTTDTTDPTSDFSVISSSIHFYALPTDYDLYPTGDTTSRGDEILDFINTTGKCRLAPGDYNIVRMYLPEGAVIVGAGKDKTRLICDGTTTTYGIKLRQNSYVADLTLECYQENGDLTPIEDYSQGANGIQIGNLESPLLESYNVTLENVYVKNFAGCGIFCRYIGQASNGATFKNVRVENCSAGFYFGEYGEYNTVIGCYARHCYTGAVVMGGNNTIADSVFSDVEIGINLSEADGYGQSTANDAHGIITGCKISHTGQYSETDGISIKSTGQASGQLISGCMFASLVDVKDRGKGLQFASCQFRGDNAITIDNSIVLVTGCSFVTAGTTGITVLNGGKFIRTGCVDFNGNVLASVT